MKTNHISTLSRVLCGIGAVALVVSLFVPLWRIELDAPQYPEGLALLIFPNKLGGDVEIINGLNHYIGMQTLHAENFIEFTLLPYIISFFAILVLSAAIAGKRKWLYIVFYAFVVFAVVSMVDFWRWEYNYGHDLDPNAAIIVPGMAYQPPLIGFKQLLNFGAYSMPDTGGWMFVLTGLLLLVSSVYEAGFIKKWRNKTVLIVLFAPAVLLAGCNGGKPVAIKLNSDKCDYCKMVISDARFAAEMITVKGRVYKFDDMTCMTGFIRENPKPAYQSVWVAAYESPDSFLDARKAYCVMADDLKSPMRGNMAAFSNAAKANEYVTKLNGELLAWETVQTK